MLNTAFSPWPSFTQQEADKVSEVLLSNKVNYWTGQEGREFEKEFATFADCKYAVALANGTLALDLALVALDIQPGDEVIVTSRTFLASASSIVTSGATPVFADVDANSQNITVDTINAVKTSKTRVILCVHLAGFPCDMPAIMAYAKKHNLLVIEDCAQAHGTTIDGQSVGSFGHIGAWSFCQDKIMTTGGEGGMVTTNDETLWKKMWAYKDHGKSYDAVYNTKHEPGFRWLHENFGTNWRLTEMQSAIGRIQLTRMPQWTKKRQKNATLIDAACANFNALRLVDVPKNIQHAQYKHYVFIRPEHLAAGWSRDKIVEAINQLGVPCLQGSCSEVYLEKAFDNTNYRPEQRLPMAKQLGETSIMFVVHPTLTDEEMQKTTHAIAEIMQKATGLPPKDTGNLD
ncbi:MAG: DegT/DnrJ/EryC1/StrS aminotransferase family protein [OCS116 cluster bacterium]|nr:DegT/DnrJ/EryC1/StrS aminotransferase family protein [OCS116 cluster bacterium]